MTTMTTKTRTAKYTVRRCFNGEGQSDASTHRTLAAAEKAAEKLNRAMSPGWSARIYNAAGERVDC